MLELFPDGTGIAGGGLAIGGIPATELTREFGTPLVVYDEATLRAQARAYRAAAPDAFIAYGTKAFPNVAIMRLLAEEGIGADVSTLGELRFAETAGISGDRLVVHGNNKSEEELAAAAELDALVVLDSLEEIERATNAGVQRTLIRFTPGIEADTHAAIRTAHHGSKFGLPAHDLIEAIERAQDTEGLHVHIGSQLLDLGAALETVAWLATFAARTQSETGWYPRVVDLGGGLGVRTSPADPDLPIADFVGTVLAELERTFKLEQLPLPQVIFEPGRSLVGRAGVTLYTVGSVKRVASSTIYVAVDGGPATDVYAIAGKHCESGDVLIDRVELPAPRRGDILAVPATGAYTLAMSSSYNVVPRPAAVLVADGKARLIRKRETIADLLALESR